MKKRILFQIYLVLFIILLFNPAKNIEAKDKKTEIYNGEVSFDDYSELTDENMDTYEIIDCDTYEITLDDTYNIHIEIEADGKGQDGYINLDFSQNEEVRGSFDKIYISSDSSKNNSINIELKKGTYLMQVAHVSSNSEQIKYKMTLNYEKIVDFKKDSASISFNLNSYTVTWLVVDMKNTYQDMKYYNFNLFEEIIINSDLEYLPTDISWKSSNKKVATVDKEGNITPYAPGKITLTVTLPNGNKTSCKVKFPHPKYTINKTKQTIFIGETMELNVSVAPEYAGMKIQWESSDTKIASIGKDGTVKGKNAGKCIISAILPNKKILKCSVTVKEKPEVVDVADYLKNPSALAKKKNDSFEFQSKNGRVTYAYITGNSANFSGLKPGGYNMIPHFLIPDYKLVDTEEIFMGKISYYKKRSTGEVICITEILLMISSIEYYIE